MIKFKRRGVSGRNDSFEIVLNGGRQQRQSVELRNVASPAFPLPTTKSGARRVAGDESSGLRGAVGLEAP
jgi:hypothetical protein